MSVLILANLCAGANLCPSSNFFWNLFECPNSQALFGYCEPIFLKWNAIPINLPMTYSSIKSFLTWRSRPCI